MYAKSCCVLVGWLDVGMVKQVCMPEVTECGIVMKMTQPPEALVCWLDVGMMKQVCMPKVAVCWLDVGMLQKVRSDIRATAECVSWYWMDGSEAGHQDPLLGCE